MVTAVGPPGGLLMARTPFERGQPPLDPAQPAAAGGVGAAVPVVGHPDPQHPVGVPDVDPGLARLGVLGHVGQQFADREVGGRLTGAGARPSRSLARWMRSGVSRVRAWIASARPRSASTGGWMPRTRARSSARALTEESRASASSARAASGLLSMICPAASRVCPWPPAGPAPVVQVPLDPADPAPRYGGPRCELVEARTRGRARPAGGGAWTGRKSRSRALPTGPPTARRPRRRWPARGLQRGVGRDHGEHAERQQHGGQDRQDPAHASVHGHPQGPARSPGR